MKEYRVLDASTTTTIQREINELARGGWILKSFSSAYEGEGNDYEKHFAVMEKSVGGSTSLEDLIDEKLTNIEDTLSAIHTSVIDIDNISERIKMLQTSLDSIESNTSQ